MSRTTTGETPYSLYFSMEAVVPVEMKVPLLRIKVFNQELNNKGILNFLDLLKEHREVVYSTSASIKVEQPSITTSE